MISEIQCVFFASRDEISIYESECTQLWESQCSWLQSPHLEILIIIKCLPQYEYILVNINNMIYTSCSFKYIAVYEVIMLWVFSLSPLADCVSRQEGDERVSERGNKVRNLATRDFVV